MARVDVPTLQCDRCKFITQDTHQMVLWQQLMRYHMSGHDTWDLCPTCWLEFKEGFIAMKKEGQE